MALIVEDGSQVTNSNSYVSRADYIAYASSVGTTIADAVSADYELIKAAEYIDSHENNLLGSLVSRSQSMAYPRNNLSVDGWSWDNDEIPTRLINCQLQFALDINNGEDLFNRNNNPNQLVKSERVEGAVSVEYAVDNASANNTIKNSKGDILLTSLLKTTGVTIGLTRV